MIKHFAADGTVKREWAEGLHASRFERDGKQFVDVAKSNAIETVELADGDQVGETFVAVVAGVDDLNLGLTGTFPAADVHPIESALSAVPVAIAPEPEPSDVVMGTGPDATPYVPVALAPETIVFDPAIPGTDKTVHHAPLPSEVVATAAHALSDAAEVLKQEEAKQAGEAKSVVYAADQPQYIPFGDPLQPIRMSVSDASGEKFADWFKEPRKAQATHSPEAVQIPTSEAKNG
jgi:hypothetical protein